MSFFAWTVNLLDIFIEDVYIPATHLEQNEAAALQRNGIDGCHGNCVKSQKVDYLIMHYPVLETGWLTTEQTTN